MNWIVGEDFEEAITDKKIIFDTYRNARGHNAYRNKFDSNEYCSKDSLISKNIYQSFRSQKYQLFCKEIEYPETIAFVKSFGYIPLRLGKVLNFYKEFDSTGAPRFALAKYRNGFVLKRLSELVIFMDIEDFPGEFRSLNLNE